MERSQFWLFWCVSSVTWRWQTRLPEATNWNEGVRTAPTALGRWLVNTLGLCGCFFFIHWHHHSSLFFLVVVQCGPLCHVASHLNTLQGSTPALLTAVSSEMKQLQVKAPDTLIDTHTHTCMHTHVHKHTHTCTHTHYWLLDEGYPWPSLLSLRFDQPILPVSSTVVQ